MKRSIPAFGSLLALCLFASCSSTGGPSGGLIGGLTGGLLGYAGDKYIGSQQNNGSTTIRNPDGSTTVIDSNGNVTNTGGTATTNNTVNVSGTGTGTTTSGTTTTGTGTVSGTGTGTTNSGFGGSIITSNNTGSSAWRDHAGLITGAVAGAAAGFVTDSFREKEAAKRYADGYAKAKSDAIKEYYWLKRDLQKTKNGGDDPPLQYRYYEVEVPAHVRSDGVVVDKHRRVIEVVE